MDPCLLRTLQVDLPIWRRYSSAPLIKGYSNITSLTPIVLEFLKGKEPQGEGQLQADELFGRLHDFEGCGDCTVETVARKKRKAFCKVAHILDPIRSMQKYYKHPEKGERRMQEKMKNPMNKAYIDCLANYLVGQLRERNLSPHFCLFYGGFQAIADKYRFAITDEFESYRKLKSFWAKRHDGNFRLVLEEFDEPLQTPATSMRSSAFSYSTRCSSSTSSSESHISLEDLNGEISGNGIELESIHSEENLPELEEVVSEESEEEEEYDENEEEEEDVNVFAEFDKYPVMLIFQEKMKGVLDELLEDDELNADRSSPEWEDRWTAWTFQICAALCAAQGVLGFTHNDLHTNNIVWTETEEAWLFYRNRAGEVWRIPTYGRIFRLIDFGRSIFRVGEKWFISDDFENGGDAEGQYNFEHMQTIKPNKPIIYPNPSFDLCRFAVSVIEALFPEMPVENLDAPLLSKEGDWELHETVSPLFNTLWSWLIDENGRNVLQDQDGSERFPDFDLYTHISAHVFSAKPQEQVCREIFKKYKIPAADVGDWETIYPLFF